MPDDPRLGPWLHSLRRWEHVSYKPPTMVGYRQAVQPMATERRRTSLLGWAIVTLAVAAAFGLLIAGAALMIAAVGSVP